MIHFDYALVSTYVPVFTALIKSLILCVSTHLFLMLDVKKEVVLCFLCWFLYVDVTCCRLSTVDKTLGHFFLIALAVYVQLPVHELANLVSNNLAVWVCSGTWSVVSSFWTACCLLRVTVMTTGHTCAFINLIFALMHVQLSLQNSSLFVICFRLTMFVVVVSLLHLMTPCLKLHEKMKFHCNIKFLCAHLLFVHIFCALGSLIVLLTVILYVLYSSTKVCAKTMEMSSNMTSDTSKSSDAILLQAAKRASGVV